MREYTGKNVKIDGRDIPYPVFTAAQYFELHDGVKGQDALEDFEDKNYEVYKLVTQILALKQSCFLLRHTEYSCQSLSDGLHDLKMRLIWELKEEHGYEFDDEWVENQAGEYKRKVDGLKELASVWGTGEYGDEEVER